MTMPHRPAFRSACSTTSPSGSAGRSRSAASASPCSAPATGQVFAVDGVCPHKGGPLADGMLVGDQVVCPLHAFRFDAATGACDQPGVCAIATYPVEVRDGAVFVTVPRRDRVTRRPCPRRRDPQLGRPHALPVLRVPVRRADGRGPRPAPAAVIGRPALPGQQRPALRQGLDVARRCSRHPRRLTSPLVRDTPASVPRGELGRGARPRRRRDSPRSRPSTARTRSGVFGSGALTNEKAYLLGKFARVALGTREHRLQRPVLHVERRGRRRTGRSASTAGCRSRVGRHRTRRGRSCSSGRTPPTRCRRSCSGSTGRRPAGGRLIVADPRRTATARAADLFLPTHARLRPRPRQRPALPSPSRRS